MTSCKIVTMFQSPRPTRDATVTSSALVGAFAVSIPASHAGRDINGRYLIRRKGVSIPASHAGRDISPCIECIFIIMFQSPRPTRDATSMLARMVRILFEFQSPRPTRDATKYLIHPPPTTLGFNPRVPRGTRRNAYSKLSIYLKFQSPRPTRDATAIGFILWPGKGCFNPRVPRGTRLSLDRLCISVYSCFNPRVPRGTRHVLVVVHMLNCCVSIPASHAGRDIVRVIAKINHLSFNPRVPRGTRQFAYPDWLDLALFQSPRPTRDATWRGANFGKIAMWFQSPRPTRDATIG